MKKIFLICLLLVAGSARAQEDAILSSYLNRCANDQQSGFLVMARLMQATGLCDSVGAVRDEIYEELYMRGVIDSRYQINSYNTGYSPEHRRFGFTLFAETDSFWETTLGKPATDITPADVQAYLLNNGYTTDGWDDESYTNPENALFQFVSYHLLPARLTPERLVIHMNELGYDEAKPNTLGIPVMEFYTTMGPRRLLKIYESRQSGGIRLNRFPRLDSSRQGSCMELSCDPDKEGVRVDTQNAVNLLNAMLYPIDGLLAYDVPTLENLANSRLRFDLASLFPELANNDIRANKIGSDSNKVKYIPLQNYEYNYLDGVSAEDGTTFAYFTGYKNNWPNYQGDEFQISGNFDLTFRLPPVPADGTYELRLGTSTYSSRTLVQIFLGQEKENLQPIGLPTDFTKTMTEPSYYYEKDTGDDEYDALVDLGMRQHGVMKTPAGIAVNGKTQRDFVNNVRMILTRQTMEVGKTYYLRLKNVLDDGSKMIQLDYIELCPAAVYDNSYVPEDIW